MPQAIIGQNFPKVVIPLIDSTKSSIDIIVFDWRWYFDDIGNPVQLFNNAIIRAVRRGVKVRVITNIAEVVKILKSQGVNCFKPITDKLIHPKMMILDQKDVVLGSHNYTQSAFTTNYEASVFLPECDCVSDFNLFFNNLFGHG